TAYLQTADLLVGAYAITRKQVGDAKRVVGSALSCADNAFLSRVIALGAVKDARDVLLYLGTDRDDNAEGVKLLVQAGVDVNARTAKPWDDSPLMRAAMTGSVRTLGVLLDGGAEINAATTHGETALWHAARAKHPDAVRVLLERGANPNLLTKPSPQWFSEG